MRELQKLTNKIRRLFNRALVRRAKYAGKIRYLQILGENGQPIPDIEHLEQYGVTSHPLPGAEAIALAFNGNGSHTVALLVGDQRHRLVIEEGETALYTHYGDKVHLRKDRVMELKAGAKVIADTPEVYCTGVVKAADFITHDDVSLGKHDHDDPESGKTSKANPS